MDPKALAYRLEGTLYDDARRYRRILQEPPFTRYQGHDPTEHQNLVEGWCRWFAEAGYGRLGLPPSLGGDPSKFNTLGYELGFLDFNLMMRFGLQFGFVLRAVSRLGDENQKHWLEKLATMEVSACLAVTEVGHGSNVRGLQTTATYSATDQTFQLRTPNSEARKDYVSALATASIALVYCRLITGGEDHGIHAFLVPLRDNEGKLLDGIEVEDCGRFGGLNGLHYGRLSFRDYTLSADHMLQRYAKVASDGSYKSSLSSPSHRFNALLGTLSVGRSLISGGAAAGSKLALTLAISYVQQRRQFSSTPGEPERTLLSYQSMQKKLMPRLATLVAIDSGRTRLAQFQHDYFEDNIKDRELETFTGALKSYTSAFAVETATVCRQACGGAGCLAKNRLTELRRDLDLFTTMEGDNTVLDLMVARNLLLDFRRGLDASKVVKALAWVGKSVNMAAQTSPLKSRDASTDNITSQEFMSKALRFRKDRLRLSLARRVRGRLNQGQSMFDALNDCQDHCLQLSKSHCEEKIFRCLRNTLESCPPGWDKRVLTHLLRLFALSRIEAERGWYLEQGYLTPKQSQSIRGQVLELCSVVAQEADKIVSSFELSDKTLGSDLLPGVVH